MNTPNKHLAQSKRQWDHKVRRWRSFLHSFDDKTKEVKKEEAVEEPPPLIESNVKQVESSSTTTIGPSIYGDFVEDEDDLL